MMRLRFWWWSTFSDLGLWTVKFGRLICRQGFRIIGRGVAGLEALSTDGGS